MNIYVTPKKTTYNISTILIWLCKNLEKNLNVFKGHSAVV